MEPHELFESELRSAGDLAGVFELDGDVGYFYLYKTEGGTNRVLDAIRILTGTPDFNQQDLSVRWDGSETSVGLFIRDRLWAVFDTQGGRKFGGDYVRTAKPAVPSEIIEHFL